MVGSGTAAPEPGRVCSGYFVEDDGVGLLLDCGPGVVHHMARFDLPWRALRHVAISHFHNDHLGDLPMLLFALKWGAKQRRTDPLTLWGPDGLRDRLEALAQALGDHVADPGFPLDVRTLRPDDVVELEPGLELAAAKTPHTDESLAFRVVGRDTALGYTGDTGPSAELPAFLAGCDTLLAECSLPDDEAIPTHLAPSSLAELAAAARPGRLLITHVYPWLDALDPAARVAAAGWDGATVRAVDGLRLTIGR